MKQLDDTGAVLQLTREAEHQEQSDSQNQPISDMHGMALLYTHFLNTSHA